MDSRLRQNPESTFEVYMEVVHPSAQSSGPEVRRQFPEEFPDRETLQTVPKFCFPFNMDSLTVNQVGQNFTFVLTDIESKHRFGFCRLSLGAHTCYCILSYLPWFEVFYKLLNILADHTIKGQESHVQELLVSLHTLPIPVPGAPVHLGVHSFVSVPDLRDLPSIPENRNLTEYFVAVDVNNMLHLFASMLYERRILICCSKLSTLTACVHGSAAMLYPMHWQHVYIPVLPQHLLDYCCAPMPYLIGVHSSLMEKVRGMALDDVVVLNVDTNTLESPYEDLQSLPNDVVSNLKSRLRRVSSATGDGVARAFLKTQAALFGSYRNALQIDSGELITFNEETFVNHRSSAMRVFLQNAIQLQLFKQFIDGRLDLLNSGEGFSDIFEEEINMGEYAGSEKAYHQWLFTVKKGGGAIFNTVKTKANPAMKTVYKFAKDHAKMGIKEVKSRLKQKESTENGFSSSGSVVINEHSSEAFATTTTAPLRREGPLRIWDDHRPITVHFGQARPPILLKRPSSNVSLESSNDQPQPYRSLKEVDLLEGGDPDVGTESHTAPPSPVTEKFSNISLLRDVFGCQDEPDSQQMTLAKSLEDLRTPKDSVELQAKFKYQHLDLNISELPQTLPGHKLFSSYNKSWSVGKEGSDASVGSAAPRDGACPPSVHLPGQPDAPLPSCDGLSPAAEPPDASMLANITIPRPHGRRTPELGSILSPPVAQTRSKGTACAEGQTASGGQRFRQVLSMATDQDLLKPIRSSDHHVDLISLLDPLSVKTTSTLEANGGAADVMAPAPRRPRPQGSPPLALHPHVSLNPFTQPLRHSSPHLHFPPGGSENPFGVAAYAPPPGPYVDAPPPPQSFFTTPGPYAQHFPRGPLLTAGCRVVPPAAASLPRSSASTHSLSGAAEAASAPGAAPTVLLPPFHVGGDGQKPEDPFGDLVTLAKPAPPPKPKVEDLRRRWETFD